LIDLAGGAANRVWGLTKGLAWWAGTAVNEVVNQGKDLLGAATAIPASWITGEAPRYEPQSSLGQSGFNTTQIVNYGFQYATRGVWEDIADAFKRDDMQALSGRIGDAALFLAPARGQGFRLGGAFGETGVANIDSCINNATMGVQEEDTHATTQGFG
jgi:hypothetical protein